MPTAFTAAGDARARTRPAANTPAALALAQRCHDDAAAAHPGLCDPAQTAAFADGADISPEVAAFRAMHDVAVAGGGATCPGLGGEGATFAKGDAKGDGKAKGKAKDEEEEEEEDDDEIDPEDEEGPGEFDVEDLDLDEDEDEDEPPRKEAKGKGAGGKKAGFAAGLVAKFREWTKAKRDELDPEDFAGPNSTFPIVDQADVDAASKLIGRARSPDAIRAKIIAIAKRKGLKLPEAWTEKDKAEMSMDVMVCDEGGRVEWA